ncbi:hypothetical protein ACSBR1_013351 [Camellia fascicularis]
MEKLRNSVIKGRFPAGLLLDMLKTRREPLLTTKLIGQGFEQNLKEILVRLMDDKVLRIGIYGMGGVGKTTLALHIHNILLEKSNAFDHVYWFTISQDFSICKLQRDIAKTLKLVLTSEDDEKKRAAQLSQELTSTRCVLILDDVWNKIPLDRVGVPNRVNGCKLVLTTGSFDVCCRMDCQASIKVKPFSDAEAWNLFREKLGQHKALSPEVREIVMAVAAECAGLPLGIITMAASMRGMDTEECVARTERTYNGARRHGKGCIASYQIGRNDLIRYLIVEGLIEEKNSLQAKLDEGHNTLNKLERSCLLERCSYECVKMHDLIRDMALKITKAGHPRFMIKAGVQLKKLPNAQEWTADLDKVSFMMNGILNIPWGRLRDSFFEHMHALQVLDLSDNSVIKELPNSISDLENLTALLLGRCCSLTSVPPLGKLRALQELDLSWTRIKEVPQGVDRRAGDDTKWDIRQALPSPTGHTYCKSVPVEELEGLRELEEIFVKLYDVGFFKSIQSLQCCVGPLNRYSLQLVCGSQSFGEFGNHIHKYGKALKLGNIIKGTRGEDATSLPLQFLLMYDRQFLEIDGCCFANNCCLCDVFLSLVGNARQLKLCVIRSCFGIECVISSCSSTSSHKKEETKEADEDQLGECCCVAFGLEKLYLSDLSDLRLGFGVIAPSHKTFSCLHELEITCCPKIKKLFSNNDNDNNETTITLPKLAMLKLVDLPWLESIYEGILLLSVIIAHFVMKSILVSSMSAEKQE